jgi:hypothetical protein
MEVFFEEMVKVWIRKFVFDLEGDFVDSFGDVGDVGLEGETCGEFGFGCLDKIKIEYSGGEDAFNVLDGLAMYFDDICHGFES